MSRAGIPPHLDASPITPLRQAQQADFSEAKLLAEKVLRSDLVLSGIDELASPTQPSLSAEVLAAANAASSSGGVSAQQLYESLLTDPRKTLTPLSSVGVPSLTSAPSEVSSGVGGGEWHAARRAAA